MPSENPLARSLSVAPAVFELTARGQERDGRGDRTAHVKEIFCGCFAVHLLVVWETGFAELELFCYHRLCRRGFVHTPGFQDRVSRRGFVHVKSFV